MKDRTIAALLATAVILALLWAAGSVVASPPREGPRGEGEVVIAAAVGESISYQGRLTDPSTGDPLDGTYTMQFQLYTAETGGSPTWDSGAQSVSVANGLFNVELDVDQDDFDGQELWLRIGVGGEWLTPRREILPVPYALSLRPGAEIKGDPSPVVLMGQNTGTSGIADGVWGLSASTGGAGVYGWATASSGETYGVYGKSDSLDGRGVYGEAPKYAVYGYATETDAVATYGVYGKSDSTYGYGVYGYATADSGYTSGVEGKSDSTLGRGVYGYADVNSGRAHGVYGKSDSPDGAGVYALGNDGGADLILGGRTPTTVGDDGKIYSEPAYPSSDIYLIANDNVRIDLDNDGDGEDADFEIYDKDNNRIFNVDESGDVTYGGPNIAAFPRPAYDSGWVSIAQNELKGLTHNLGGNTDNYVVDLQFKDDPGGYGVNNIYYGGGEVGGNYYGANWAALTNTTIVVMRFPNDTRADKIRVRIWVYK